MKHNRPTKRIIFNFKFGRTYFILSSNKIIFIKIKHAIKNNFYFNEHQNVLYLNLKRYCTFTSLSSDYVVTYMPGLEIT
jgi:hypothetical protein